MRLRSAGSFCYIGPQGIVHGTTLTILNAGRKYLNRESMEGANISSILLAQCWAQGWCTYRQVLVE